MDFTIQKPRTTGSNVRGRPVAGDDLGTISPNRAGDFGITDVENEYVPYKRQKKVSHSMVEGSEHIDLSDNDDEDVGNQSDENTSSRSVTVGPNKGRTRKRNDRKQVPRIEESLSEFVSLRKEQVAAKEMVKKQGEEFSITRCLAVLKDIDDVSDEIRIGASDVFKDVLNRQLFLGYEPRLRGMWLKREVSKFENQSTSSKLWFSN